MSQINERPVRATAQGGSTSSKHSQTIAAAVDAGTRSRAAEVAGTYLSNLTLAAKAAVAKAGN
ncbi:hypothetical protein [Streptomyces sp. NPDC048638]|uniref:hypothetical protein n=1 Tax=Streptomyces sp. NPDC048638 TaxID=3365580 RepID=UPI00371552EC